MFFLELKGNPNFQGILNWILQILHYSSQEWTKMFPNHKVLGEEKKDWIVTQEGKRSYWKNFMENQIKSRNSFPAHQQQSKTDLSKETKKASKKDTPKVSEVLIQKGFV